MTNWDAGPSDILGDIHRGFELLKRTPPPPIEIMSPERYEKMKQLINEPSESELVNDIMEQQEKIDFKRDPVTATNELKKAFKKCTEVIKECGEALKKLPKERSHMAKVTAKQRLQRKKKKRQRQQKKKSR